MASYELLETSLNHLRSALGLLEGRKEKSSSILQEMNYVKYNLAVISQKGLAMLYDKKPEQRDRGMIERAVKNVEEAQRLVICCASFPFFFDPSVSFVVTDFDHFLSPPSKTGSSNLWLR